MKTNSGFFSINFFEVLKGLAVAMFGALITGLYDVFVSGVSIEFTWIFFKPIVIAAVTAGLAYLMKTFFQNSSGVLFQPEKKV